MKMLRRDGTRAVLLLGLSAASVCLAQSPPAPPAPAPALVTVDNFARAETDRYFAGRAAQGGFGRFFHFRDFPPPGKSPVVRINRDTLYSVAVVDLDAGPVTVTLPDAGARYRMLMSVSEDHYLTPAIYSPGRHTFTRQQVGTRYAMLSVRTLFDPNSPGDVDQVHALQDALKLEQAGSGSFKAPAWDAASLKRVRDALLVLGEGLPDTRGMFGAKDQVDPVRHLVGTAMAWGGIPEKDALYLNVTPPRNDGGTVYRMRVQDVPVDGFWSISVYDEQGQFRANAFNAYVVNNTTAQRGPDGSVDVQFGDCDGRIPNCLPTMPGWNYMVRLYRPRAEVLQGRWTFPQAQPAER